MKKIKKQTLYVEEVGEINTLPSETVPDMALSPQELLENYSRGNTQPEAFYDEENQWDLQGLDLTEIDRLREYYKERQTTAKKGLEELERERMKVLQEQEEKVKKERLKEYKELTQQENQQD